MTQLEGTFKVMHWEEAQYDAAQGQPRFTHARVTHELSGAIEGEVSICYLMVHRPDDTANFAGLATVTGTIDGREGSFVMQDVGTVENGVTNGRWTILPGLGSGGLRCIRGDGHFASTGDGATYSLNVDVSQS